MSSWRHPHTALAAFAAGAWAAHNLAWVGVAAAAGGVAGAAAAAILVRAWRAARVAFARPERSERFVRRFL